MDTVALETPACPCLYTNSCKFVHRTCCKLVIPMTKQMESRMLDFPEPLNPVMALNTGSKLVTVVRVAYDLNPSRHISLMNIAPQSPLRPRKSPPKTLQNPPKNPHRRLSRNATPRQSTEALEDRGDDYAGTSERHGTRALS